MTGQDPSVEQLLATFATDYKRDPATLGTYCAQHPRHAAEFIGFAHELNVQLASDPEAPLDAAGERMLARVLEQAHPTDPFAGLGVADYNLLRQALGVPSLVLNAFRDRAVATGTVPLAFLEHLADGLKVTLDELATFLAGPPRLSRAVRHKSAAAPFAGADKLPFAELLEEAGVSGVKFAELIADAD